MNKIVSKNALPTEIREKARKILSSAGISKIAKKLDVPSANIYNILLGKSQNIELLDSALKEANEIIEQRKQLIANLPL